MKKKVLHVINSLMPGGAENLLINSLVPGGLQEHTDNLLVYFMGSSGLENKIDPGIKWYNLNYKGMVSLPATLLKLRKIIKEQRIDIVHSHLNPAGFYTHLACPSNIPQVHTLHTTYSMDRETPPVKLFLEKELYFKKRSCNLIFLSEFTKADFLNTVPFKGKYFVLNNFVPDQFFTNTVKEYAPGRKDLRIIATGRLNEVKNYEYLLKVFSHLKNRAIYLDIYGSGDKTKYEKEISEQGINVKMMGHHNNLQGILGNYDLFIMPSIFEGFPLSVFEAMASGLPLMLSAIAPLKSIVKDHAIYFELDNEKAVAKTLELILDKKMDINSTAKLALIYAERTVRMDLYINRLLDIYKQI